jgi:ribonucleoside-diphosphate reductase alpha chain
MRSLNELLENVRRTDKQLDDSMDVWWASFEAELSKAKGTEEDRRGRPISEPNPTDGDRLRTIEDLIRALGKKGESERLIERIVTRYVATRRPLPERRAGYTQGASIGNHEILLRTGEYSDGALGEIFIDIKREGVAFQSVIGAFASAVSIALQHGVPLEELVNEFMFARFEPSGEVMGHPFIKTTTSIIDLIFRELAVTYLNRRDLMHIPLDALGADEDVPTERAKGEENKSNESPPPAASIDPDA